ncbi:MAG: hypothetical protein OGM61_10200 [Clostridiales bacterium]|nr:MAG: hypothetical protein OGM61_10200 [Clostridiales bacterium]
MTACPIRYQRQVSDRKGKIFYTSITSLSHISKKPGRQTARRGRRRRPDRRDPCPPAVRPAWLSGGRTIPPGGSRFTAGAPERRCDHP